uniref:Uncharacterized protein n=1 Tax=Astyanax mexicanus TaxID=7994 RepID=A0A8B9KRJ8_ASTMX
MGVPSVKREVHTYLTDTLSSLMSELSQAEKEDCVIVVFIAEVSALANLTRDLVTTLIPPASASASHNIVLMACPLTLAARCPPDPR